MCLRGSWIAYQPTLTPKKHRSDSMPAEVESCLGQHEPTQEKESTSCACEQTHTQRLTSETSFQPRDATDEEIAILPHIADRLPFAAWIVIFAGAAERFTYYAVIAPWRALMSHNFPKILKYKRTNPWQRTTCRILEDITQCPGHLDLVNRLQLISIMPSFSSHS
jgi:hypothetical protein